MLTESFTTRLMRLKVKKGGRCSFKFMWGMMKVLGKYEENIVTVGKDIQSERGPEGGQVCNNT